MSMAERPIFGNGLIHVPKAALKSDLRYLTPVSTGIINYYNMDKRKMGEDFGAELGSGVSSLSFVVHRSSLWRPAPPALDGFALWAAVSPGPPALYGLVP